MSLFVTDQCNLRCSYCFSAGASSREIDWNTARRAVDFLFENSSGVRKLHLSFWGGEPLLAWPLVRRIVQYARKKTQEARKKIDFSIPTNLTILTPEMLEFIANHHIHLSLSIDGTAESQSLRKTPSGASSYDSVSKNLDLLQNSGMGSFVSVRKTVVPSTAENLYRDVAFFLEHGLREITFSPVMETEWNQRNLAVFEEQQRRIADRWIHSLMTEAPFSIKLWDQMLHQRLSSRREARYCGAGISMLAVDTAGRLYPCHRFVRYDDGEGSQLLGDVDSGIDINSPFQLYAGIDTESRNSRTAGCSSCKYIQTCLLFCPAVNFKLTGNPLTNDPRLCGFEMICERIVDTLVEGTRDIDRLKSYLLKKQLWGHFLPKGQPYIDKLTDAAERHLAEIQRDLPD
jgi:uncharacterized protein